ncbi:MAG: hypothetical protein K9K63_11555 [Desulfotignum sp.]|nr:hypothetical protein [Desulfotignum sp.]MCF8088545.1 hypothetical protein [Desulfotignum sp.]MCF8137935.1 hypothetical protein [Desulfotignum sp.]
MHSQVETLLKKISYIETDMELHKQILFSIPSNQKEEMEKVMQTISEQKQQVRDLRREIKRLDPAAYDRILAIEQGTKMFKTLAQDKQFDRVDTPDDSGACKITLSDGTDVDCLVAAREENGDWMILTRDGEVKQFPKGLVKQGTMS